MEQFHGTTIVSVRRGDKVALGGDGQVTLGNIVMKGGAKKVRRIYNGKVMVASPAAPPTRSRCSTASKPSSKSIRAISPALRWNSPKTGVPTACCAASKPC